MTPASYRPDIDGLRAFAVTAVVAFHASPHVVPGGFVGVDIFLVISGYLITISGFAWPLLIGGVLKIAYDLALLAMFSRVRPPEERRSVPSERRG